MTELKPCPFCGGEARISEKIVEYNGKRINEYMCYCSSCFCSTPPFPIKDDAINVWNKRSNHWHTGTPTEKGAYLIKLESQDKEVSYTIMPMEAVICGNKLYMKNDELSIVAWQKIEEGEK